MRAIALLLLVFTTSLAALAQQRFDFKVREDMFAGMDGDTVAFDRAMKLIADTLAREPDHAEALVWRGDGRLFMAGQAFQRGDIAAGQKLFAEGLADMERAVALGAQRHRGPRAAGVGPVALCARAAPRRPRRSRPVDAHRRRRFRVRAAGEPVPLGQAQRARSRRGAGRAGRWLADAGRDRQGRCLPRSHDRELPGTAYAKNAGQRRADPSARTPLTCLGCH